MATNIDLVPASQGLLDTAYGSDAMISGLGGDNISIPIDDGQKTIAMSKPNPYQPPAAGEVSAVAQADAATEAELGVSESPDRAVQASCFLAAASFLIGFVGFAMFVESGSYRDFQVANLLIFSVLASSAVGLLLGLISAASGYKFAKFAIGLNAAIFAVAAVLTVLTAKIVGPSVLP